MNSKITEIEQAMQAHLDNYQMEQLHRVLFHVFEYAPTELHLPLRREVC